MSWKYYDYKCDKCEHEFEEMVKSSDEYVECPECSDGPCEIMLTSNLGWTNNPESKKEMLIKRSKEHTAKEKRNGNVMSERDLIGK